MYSPQARTSRGGGTKRDTVLWAVLVWSAVLSVVALIATYRAGNVLAYNDAISHMMIARRVTSGIDTGAAQLGNVWLPGPHIAMLPLVIFDGLYYSGLAGAIISMISFVVCCGFLYATARQFTGSKVAGVVTAAVFALNMNVLYMQSTPMTELPLFAALTGVVYYLQVWADSGYNRPSRQYRYLVRAAVAALIATLIRYEAWVVLIVLAIGVVIAALRESRAFPQQRRLKLRLLRTVDLTIVFSVLAFAGIAFWLLWNQILFGGMFDFQNGDYAKPSLWLTSSEPAIGDWALSIKTFWFAMTENIPLPVLLMAGMGLVLFIEAEVLAAKREHRARAWFVLALLTLAPFFVFAIYSGQRPLHVLQVNDSLYNIRFGLIMIIPAALFAGYLVGFFRKFGPIKMVVALLVVSITGFFGVLDLRNNHVVTLNDPVVALTEDRAVWTQEAIDGFRSVYASDDKGTVLIETFGNERLAFTLVPSNKMVYEGTNKDGRWKHSLADPAGNDIEWIVMRCVPDYRDRVCNALENSAALAGYGLVYSTQAGYKLYKKNG